MDVDSLMNTFNIVSMFAHHNIRRSLSQNMNAAKHFGADDVFHDKNLSLDR